MSGIDEEGIAPVGSARAAVVTVRANAKAADRKMPRKTDDKTMSTDAFVWWFHKSDLTVREAAAALGVSESRFDEMMRGHKRGTNAPTKIPYAIALACAAVAEGLGPYAWDEELSAMPKEEFVRWREEMGRKRGYTVPLPHHVTADLLGLATAEVPVWWEKGSRRYMVKEPDSDKTKLGERPVRIGRTNALALSALLHGLEPWTAVR